MKAPTIPGKYYIVRSKTGCTVTQETSPGNYITASIPADEDTPVFAHAGKFDIDDDGAIVTEVFKLAPQQKLALLGVLGGNAGGLPAGYTRVKYLESTGTQYIRLPELTVTNDDIIKTRWLFVKFFKSIANGVFAIYNYDGGEHLRTYTTERFSGGKRGYGCDWDAKEVNLSSIREKEIIDIEMSNSGAVVNGVITKYENTVPFSYSDMLLFTQYVLGNFWPSCMRLYNFEVPSKCSLLPALDSTGAPCMFDTVTRTPFYNSGAGAFVVGIETQTQLNNMLLKLPDRTGLEVGTLQVRLADALQTPANEAKLDAMFAKNWEITQAA
jgi:hypothetical protein